MAITKQDVWRVANEIDGEGCKPSAVEVRRRLGTGSYTTITAALREWVKPEAEQDDELEPMPAEFEERIAQAGADLFALAMKIAGEQFQAERDAWGAERAGIEAERDEAIRLADQVSAELDEAREAEKRLQREITLTIEERTKAFALADERARNAQEARQTAAEAQQQGERLNGQIEHLRNTCDTATRKNDKLTAELARVTDLAHERHEAIMQMQAENARLDAEVHRTTERTTTAEAERDQARKDAAQAREDAERLLGRVEALQDVIATLKTPSPAPEAEKPKKTKGRPIGDKQSTRPAGSVTKAEANGDAGGDQAGESVTKSEA